MVQNLQIFVFNFSDNEFPQNCGQKFFITNIFKIFIFIQTMRIFMLFISRFEPCVESSVYTMCHPSCHRAASSKPKVKQALVA